ncbi:hypothetical protein MTR_4g028100 [Medicago truncatula]|uniref:Uncharacterized protein n=1 Tax=Medicago truncatula TaxID=3880 RepID=G7JIA8_MEDTR|nr:hypothetical protein MTR_4g028100 [Medicago truncatula]
MVSEPLHNSLGHLLSGFRYRATRHLCSRFRCAILSMRGGVKSPASVRSWSNNLFISGGNPHLTSRFYGVVLGPTTISNTTYSKHLIYARAVAEEYKEGRVGKDKGRGRGRGRSVGGSKTSQVNEHQP